MVQRDFCIFEDLFHTMFKMQSEKSEKKFNHFYAQLQNEPLQTFRSIGAPKRNTFDDVQTVFWQINVKRESQATAKHNRHKFTFDPNTKSLSDFLEELNQCAEKAFSDNAQHLTDNLLYAKLPAHLKRSLNLAYVEKSTNVQIVAHLAKDLELSGLKTDGELSAHTTTAVSPNNNAQKNWETFKFYGITVKNLAMSLEIAVRR